MNVNQQQNMPMIRAVTAYCSSSSAIARAHFDAATELGAAIARNGWHLVYGGNAIGLMGHLADAVRAAGGRVVGITPQLLVDKGIHDTRCDELIVTTGMRERKALMEQRGDGYIALPGGLGTFEEIFEIIVAKQLRYHAKPIVLLNTDDYYRPLLAMIEHGIEQQFIKPKARQLYFVAATVTEAVEHLRTYTPPAPSEKGLGRTVPSGVE
jgi:cytokinin riboside 5'-monophosphate phosphoribohydrolase